VVLTKTANTNAIAGDGVAGTTDVTISGGTLTWNANEQVANDVKIVMTSGALNLAGKTETLGSFTNSGGTFSTGAGHLIGTGASVTWSGGTNTVNDGGVVEDSHIVITGGTNTVNGGTIGGVLQLNSGGTGLEMSNGSTLMLDSSNTTAGKLLLKGDVSTSGDSTVTIVSGLALTNKGTIDLDGVNTPGARTFTVADGAAATDLAVGAVITNGSLTKTGAGTMTLTGANTYTGTTTVSGGTLLLGAANTLQTGSTTGTRTAVALTGGKLDTGGFAPGDATNTLGSLTLSGTSTLALGTGTGETLRFSDLGTTLTTLGSTALTIQNWSGTAGLTGGLDQILFGAIGSNTTGFDYSQIRFDIGGVYYSGALALVGSSYELYADQLEPIPEPTTVFAGLALVGLIGFRERRRLGALFSRERVDC
jgi:autotransporter-associated beta strand protein